jgi:two-component system, chemotaxis family, CheB/CheR fusion protein
VKKDPKKPSERRKIKPASRKGARTVKSASSSVHTLPAVEQIPPVVGIGASAGGLEAYTQLLRSLPTNTGMAFVLVQHLEPRHESVLTRLLAKATRMPVQEAREGMRVEPDSVYVIPSNADLSLMDGLLHIVRRKALAGHHMPIDSFLESLAKSQGPRAIGVILSGTASDGTAGIEAVKAEGGITFAQQPDSAKFDGMPRNAIASGCVDFVLPPPLIAQELARIAHHPFVGLLPPRGTPVIPAGEDDWAHLFRLLRLESGVDFTEYKPSTIKRRVARRMAVHKIEHLNAYLKLLESNTEELGALFQEILIEVTEFFRDPDVFLALRDKTLPEIFSAKPAGEPLRVWVAGCSTGEEAYSIAICALEYLSEARMGTTLIQIFATDLSDPAIQKARAGRYPEGALRGVSQERLRRFFTRVDGNYEVNPSIREMCVFARHDVTKDPPFSKLDLISCRNVLIYFESALQRKVLAFFHYGLKKHGALLLGKTESLGTHTDLFTIADRKLKTFWKNTMVRVPLAALRPAHETQLPHDRQPGPTLPDLDLEKETDRVVWERYGHAGLVVNNDLRILHFRGDTGPYLRPASGKATFQLLRMVRDELALELRTAIQEARRTGRSVRREGIEVKQDRQVREVHIEVRPLPVPGEREKCFLILFESGGSRTRLAARTSGPRGTGRKGRDQELLRLQSELERSREHVQAIIRDQETTNEELKTANEETLSSMEELQSTNEELETAKEELQSSNEELVTVNEQLQNRNADLAILSDDLINVLSGVNIPILILDQDRRIRRFTPPAEKLLRLLPGDIGRPIGDLRIGISIPDMEKVIASVIEKGSEMHREVRGEENGRWYMLSVRPFQTAQGRIDGVLMAFVDVHDLKQQQESLQKEHNFVSAILNAAKGLLVVVLDSEGRIVHFNRSCQELSGYSFEEAKGRRVWDFLLVPEEIAGVKATFENVLGGTPNQYENHWLTKDGRSVLTSWSNSVSRSDGSVEYLIGTGTDITGREQAEERAQESESTIRALLETAAQAILAVDARGQIILANAATEKMFGYSRRELIGEPVAKLVPARSGDRHAVYVSQWFSRPVSRPMGRGLEIHCMRKDGSEFPSEISLSSIAGREGTIGVAFISDITERITTEATLRSYQSQLQRLTGNLLSTLETGNRELARELHDDFSQQLVALGMEVSSLRQSRELGKDVAARLGELGRKIARLGDEIHSTSRRLHPAILEDLGLEAAMLEECRGFREHFHIPVDFVPQNVPAVLPKEVSLCLYRVVQESLRNIAKHSRATQVYVRLAGGPGTDGKQSISLRVEDQGDGFDLDQALRKGGLGFISMEERVRLVGGTLTIQSQPGQGTTVTALVPLNGKPI